MLCFDTRCHVSIPFFTPSFVSSLYSKCFDLKSIWSHFRYTFTSKMLRQVKKRYFKTMQGAQNISFFSITSFIFMFVRVIYLPSSGLKLWQKLMLCMAEVIHVIILSSFMRIAFFVASYLLSQLFYCIYLF